MLIEYRSGLISSRSCERDDIGVDLGDQSTPEGEDVVVCEPEATALAMMPDTGADDDDDVSGLDGGPDGEVGNVRW